MLNAESGLTNDSGAEASSVIRHHASIIDCQSSFVLHVDPPAPGPWNMAVDEALLEAAAADGQCILRFYQWQEPTLSLGYFQAYSDRWQHAPSSGVAVVRRMTGGGAILHDKELTYSVAIPSRHPLAIDRLKLYEAVHAGLIATLAQWGIAATICGQPARLSPDRQPFLCFERRSPGDVLLGDAKIAGSARRRCRGAVLQHGSILLRQSAAAPELSGLCELTGKSIEPEELTHAWLSVLTGQPRSARRPAELSSTAYIRATALAHEKYAAPVWTEHR